MRNIIRLFHCAPQVGRSVCSHHHAVHHHTVEPLPDGAHVASCKRVTLCGAALNVTLCAGKIALGSTGASIAMMADALHALMDVMCDLVSFTAVTLSTRRVSKHTFPFGIGRTETAGAVVVSLMLLCSGVGLLMASIRRLLDSYASRESDVLPGAQVKSGHEADGGTHHHRESHTHGAGACCGGGHGHDQLGHSHLPDLIAHSDEGRPVILWSMVGVSFGAVASKVLMYRWAKEVGRRTGSAVVTANGYHHRADALTSAVTMVGVAGAAAGLPALDALAGLAVASTIVSTASRLLSASVLEFFDFQAKTLLSMRDVAYPVPRGEGVAPVVNVFTTRHGRKLVVHASLLVGGGLVSPDFNKTAAEMKAAFQALVPGGDVAGPFFSFINIGESADDVGAAAGSRALMRVLSAVQDFHGIPTVDVDDECKVLFVPKHLVDSVQHGDCLGDITTVARIFGYTVQPACDLST